MIRDKMKENERLDSLAFDLKFKPLTPAQKNRYNAELFSILLRRVNNPEIHSALSDFNNSEESLTESECIGLSIIADTYIDVFNKYGTEKWMENGRPVSFVKMFFGFLKRKLMYNYSVATQKFFAKDDTKLYHRRITLKKILEIIAKERKIDNYTAPDNITNFEKVVNELQKIGFDEIESIRKAPGILERSSILTINYEENPEKDEDVPGSVAIGNVVAEQQQIQETAISEALMPVVNAYRLVMEDDSISANDKQNVRYYMTGQLVEHYYEENPVFQEMIDKDFALFLKKKRNEKVKLTFNVKSEFFGKRPDTVRKKTKSAQDLLLSKKRCLP